MSAYDSALIAHGDLPYAQSYKYDAWPERREGDREMEFRLTYKGKLPAASSSDGRVKDKHRIRQALHLQLRELWQSDPILRTLFRENKGTGRPHFELLADDYARCGYRFLPLVGSPASDEACSLDILFLRRDQPGSLVTHGGDIDNRVKVLLDALRMPEGCDEVYGNTPTADEEPFFCLLTDDKIITEIRVVTDRLLTPREPGEYEHDVHLIIHVKTITYSRKMPLFDWVQ